MRGGTEDRATVDEPAGPWADRMMADVGYDEGYDDCVQAPKPDRLFYGRFQ